MTSRLDMTTGVPAAVPAAWSNQPTNLAGTGAPAATRATTTTRSGCHAASRVGRRGLGAVRDSLSARDWDVLRHVNEHRYLTSRQVEGFCFHDHATPLTGARVCRRVLRRLANHHVLQHLERRVGGVQAGSASLVWQVGPVGDRLLRTDPERPRRRQRLPGQMFLDHCLAIADAHLALVRAHRANQLELLQVQTEPDCWRPYTGFGGARLVLQPDLYIVTGAGDFEDHWFIEIDRGTENPARLLAKSARYQAYRQSGIEQANGGSFPLVVWVMPDNRQADRLRAAIDRDTALDDGLYRITTADRFVDAIRGGAV